MGGGGQKYIWNVLDIHKNIDILDLALTVGRISIFSKKFELKIFIEFQYQFQYSKFKISE